LRRELTAVSARDARTLETSGRTYVNFASNDYLALRFHEALIARAKDWAETYGTGSGASRLVTGNLDLFGRLEAKVAALKNKPAALVMASGFQANAAVLQALLDKTVLGAEPLVFADRLNHASMHFGCKAAGIRQLRYRHGDVAHLAELLTQYQTDNRLKFILTESVFSMDGDRAPIAEIARLASSHDAMLIVDDAHATGILGEGGRGLSDGADMVIGTFSKALGSFGAYVACSETMRDYLVNRCRPFIYATAPSPLVAAIVRAALLICRFDAARRARLDKLVAHAGRQLESRCGIAPSGSQIQPVILGADDRAVRLAAAMQARGFDIRAVRPPTVAEGTARLRLSLTLNVDEACVNAMTAALAEELARGNA